MADRLSVSHPFRTGSLSSRTTTRFDLQPDPNAREEVARLLGILAVPRLAFKGEIRPVGRADFVLEGKLVAAVVQPCVVTLESVTSKIDQAVIRRYLSDFVEPEGEEAEVPADDTVEPLTEIIDPGEVMVEALALAVPDYPRVPGAILPETVHAGPGLAPLRDDDLRPFASLASLARKLSGDDPDSGGSPSG